MNKIFTFFSLFLMILVCSLTSSAKVVKCTTNDTKATYLSIPGEYSVQPVYWNDQASVEVTLPSNKGLNVHLYDGYYINSITVNGEVVSEAFASGTFYIKPGLLPDGATVVINASAKQPVNVIVKGDPTQIAVTYLYYEYPANEWKEGELRIPVTSANNSIKISARPGYNLSAVLYKGNNIMGDDLKSYSILPSSLPTGDNVFEVSAYNMTESRTSEFTVDINGDPSKVNLTLAGDRNKIYTGAALEKPISFNPQFDLPVIIQNEHYGSGLYRVLVGEEEQVSENRIYYLYDIEDKEVVTVDVDYPDIQIPIRLNFTNPDTESSIKSVIGTYGSIISPEEWSKEGWTVPMGTLVNISFNLKDYRMKVSLNGVPTDLDYITIFAVDENGYDVEITADPLPPFEVTFYYESLPSHFKVKLGNDENYVEMTGEESTIVEVPRNKSRINIIPDEGWMIQFVVAGSVDAGAEIVVTENIDVEVYMEEYRRDLESVIYIDPASDWLHTSMTLSENHPFRKEIVTLTEGYNEIWYNELDLPFMLELALVDNATVIGFLNGEVLEDPIAEIKDVIPGSVLRFYDEYPEFYNVSFLIDKEAVAEVYMDIIDFIPAPENLRVMDGTRFTVVPENVSEVVVKVDGVEQLQKDGRYDIDIHSDLTVSIDKGTPSGITGISEQQKADVYSLQGIKILPQADIKEVEGLPRGVYIIAGKKVMIK